MWSPHTSNQIQALTSKALCHLCFHGSVCSHPSLHTQPSQLTASQVWLVCDLLPSHCICLPSCLPYLSFFKTSLLSFLEKSHPICHSSNNQICFEWGNLGNTGFLLFSATSHFLLNSPSFTLMEEIVVGWLENLCPIWLWLPVVFCFVVGYLFG